VVYKRRVAEAVDGYEVTFQGCPDVPQLGGGLASRLRFRHIEPGFGQSSR